MSLKNSFEGMIAVKGREYSKKTSIIISFAAFFIVLAVLVFGAFPLQLKFGNAGLVLTELLMLGIAVAGCVITGQRFSEMFPVKLPTLRQLAGTVLIWVSMYLFSMVASAVSGMLMPERFFAVSTALNGMSVPFRLVTVAILAPVCEEAMHRGLVTHFLKPVEHKWIIMIIIGLQFGVLHWEPVKFLSTAIAGAFLAYVLLKTQNILLCVFMHFLTNFPAVFASGVSADFNDAVAYADGMISGINFDMSMMTLSIGASAGLFMLLGSVAPWLFYGGSVLLGKKGVPDVNKKKKVTASAVICIAFAAAGVITCAVYVTLLTSAVMAQL